MDTKNQQPGKYQNKTSKPTLNNGLRFNHFALLIFCTIAISGCNILPQDEEFEGAMEAIIDGELIIFERVYEQTVSSSDDWSDWTRYGTGTIIGITNREKSGYEVHMGLSKWGYRGYQPGDTIHPYCVLKIWKGNYNENRHTFYSTAPTMFFEYWEYTSNVTLSANTSDRLTGTFSFTAYAPENDTDSLMVTEGTFKVDKYSNKNY